MEGKAGGESRGGRVEVEGGEEGERGQPCQPEEDGEVEVWAMMRSEATSGRLLVI